MNALGGGRIAHFLPGVKADFSRGPGDVEVPAELEVSKDDERKGRVYVFGVSVGLGRVDPEIAAAALRRHFGVIEGGDAEASPYIVKTSTEGY